MPGDGVPGGGRQGQRLQQRHRGRQRLGADDRGGGGHRPVRAGQDGQRGQEFGEVKVSLPLGGGQLGEAEVGQPGQHVAVDHHVGRSQGPVGDPGAVQPVYFSPQPPEEVIADLLRREVAERAAVHPVHDQQRGPAAGLDHLLDAGDADAGPLGHHRDEGLVLDGPDDRGRGPRVADVAQPGVPVGPVEQVGVTLICAEGLDEQPLPVIGDRHERPGALGLDVGRVDGGDLQPARAQRGRDPVGSDPPVGYAEGHQHAGADGHPGGEREYQFGRQDGTGDQPGRGRGGQRDPCCPAPGTAQPGRRGHGDRCRGGEQGRAGERRAGQPRAVPGSGGYRVRVLVAGQVQDAGQRGAGRGGACGQAGQQPEPAVAQRGGGDPGGRDDEGYLHQAGQQPPGRAGSGPGHGGRAGTKQPTVRHRDCCERPGQHRRADDQADDVARMTVPGGRQEPPRMLRDRFRAAGRLIDGRQILAWMGFSALAGLVRVHAGLRPRSACSGGGAPAGCCVPAGCRRRCCRCWSRPAIRAAVRAQDVPRRIPAVASDSQWAPR